MAMNANQLQGLLKKCIAIQVKSTILAKQTEVILNSPLLNHLPLDHKSENYLKDYRDKCSKRLEKFCITIDNYASIQTEKNAEKQLSNKISQQRKQITSLKNEYQSNSIFMKNTSSDIIETKSLRNQLEDANHTKKQQVERFQQLEDHIEQISAACERMDIKQQKIQAEINLLKKMREGYKSCRKEQIHYKSLAHQKNYIIQSLSEMQHHCNEEILEKETKKHRTEITIKDLTQSLMKYNSKIYEQKCIIYTIMQNQLAQDDIVSQQFLSHFQNQSQFDHQADSRPIQRHSELKRFSLHLERPRGSSTGRKRQQSRYYLPASELILQEQQNARRISELNAKLKQKQYLVLDKILQKKFIRQQELLMRRNIAMAQEKNIMASNLQRKMYYKGSKTVNAQKYCLPNQSIITPVQNQPYSQQILPYVMSSKHRAAEMSAFQNERLTRLERNKRVRTKHVQRQQEEQEKEPVVLSAEKKQKKTIDTLHKVEKKSHAQNILSKYDRIKQNELTKKENESKIGIKEHHEMKQRKKSPVLSKKNGKDNSKIKIFSLSKPVNKFKQLKQQGQILQMSQNPSSSYSQNAKSQIEETISSNSNGKKPTLKRK